MSCKLSVSKIAAEFSLSGILIFEKDGIHRIKAVWINIKKRMFDSFVFLPLSTRAFFKGRAYIKIILKNHARSYFAGRSYYRGNTVIRRTTDLSIAIFLIVKIVEMQIACINNSKFSIHGIFFYWLQSRLYSALCYSL